MAVTLKSEDIFKADTPQVQVKPQKRARKKSELWRVNNQLAQKRFRQQQKVWARS